MYTQVPVDAVMLETRAAALASRSIKTSTKRIGIDLAIACVDLTTLEGRDSAGRVRSLCVRAMHPDPSDATVPHVGAVCVYPNLVAIARETLGSSPVHLASVATAFPSGQAEMSVKLADTEQALESGADEIDMVIDRGAFLEGNDRKVASEIEAIKELCRGRAHLKVILETGELGSYENIRRASDLALHAGADTIKTSTGKIGTNATLPTALLMCEAIRDFADQTGELRGLKVAGGVRTTKQALAYLVVVNETLGADWLTPDRFRIGASSLLDDLLMQRQKERSGRYAGNDYISKD
ncbi:MAG: deoxyribose-phosphate aldolase [Vulcanimicrobiaceae bacterium]